MSHNYLIDTYSQIARRLEAAQQQADSAVDDLKMAQEAAGRIEALHQFEQFLSIQFDARLPRRLALKRKRF